MEYINANEAAALLGISPRRMQQRCIAGEIKDAKKIGRSWQIPKTTIESMMTNTTNGKKPLPIGISDYKVASRDYFYVDKTLMIKDFLDKKPQVSLFTRPRRFGKTLNMDMLRVFFEKTDEDNSIYFRDKAIWSCGEAYTSYQGKYPVIFLSFKDVKCTNWQLTYDMLTKLIMMEFRRHIELEDSTKLNKYEREQFSSLAKGTAGNSDYQLSLQILSLLLHKHYGKEAIIIIDEYDTPIQQGHTCGFYQEVIDFMRNLFSGGLKDNNHLAYGFLTGILRVAKESIFSGLNNLIVNSIMDNPYSKYFGFTKEEIEKMLAYYGYQDKFDEVCEWYDGYMFGNTEIFNPWSVINYVSKDCYPEAFWQSTGSNEIIGEIIYSATDEITENLYSLLNGESITSYIDTGVIYPQVQSDPYSIYSFLLVAGYLRISKKYPQNDGNYMCEIAIPNKEIAFVYEKEVLSKAGITGTSVSIQQAIFKGDPAELQKLLEKFMINSISVFDGTNESFYHGMMLGLCAVLSNKYRIKSNSESGYGRFDVSLIPNSRSNPGFIFEFKHAKSDSDNLDSLADEALNQIEEKKYDAELKSLGITNIIKIGIAFRGKNAIVKRA